MPNSIALQPELWIDRHADVLYRFALARVGRVELAEDLVQETLLAALRSRGSFAGQSSERTWLIGILKHRLIDQIRKTARGAASDVLEQDEVVNGMFSESGKWRVPPADWGVPDRAFEQAEFWAVFQRCLAALPPRLGAALSLRDIEGIDSDRVCEILAISPTNLWTLVHRARLRLRACLEKHWFNVRG